MTNPAPAPTSPRICLPVAGVGALFAGLGVAAGAFGAHGLRAMLAEPMLVVYETAVRYQMYHALALLVLAVLAVRLPPRTTLLVAGLFTGGIVFFSGSLYLLALTGTRPLGMLTPVGGTLFIAGWAVLAWGALRGR